MATPVLSYPLWTLLNIGGIQITCCVLMLLYQLCCSEYGVTGIVTSDYGFLVSFLMLLVFSGCLGFALRKHQTQFTLLLLLVVNVLGSASGGMLIVNMAQVDNHRHESALCGLVGLISDVCIYIGETACLVTVLYVGSRMECTKSYRQQVPGTAYTIRVRQSVRWPQLPPCAMCAAGLQVILGAGVLIVHDVTNGSDHQKTELLIFGIICVSASLISFIHTLARNRNLLRCQRGVLLILHAAVCVCGVWIVYSALATLTALENMAVVILLVIAMNTTIVMHAGYTLLSERGT